MIYVIYQAFLTISVISTSPLTQGPKQKPPTPQGKHNKGLHLLNGHNSTSSKGINYG